MPRPAPAPVGRIGSRYDRRRRIGRSWNRRLLGLDRRTWWYGWRPRDAAFVACLLLALVEVPLEIGRLPEAYRAWWPSIGLRGFDWIGAVPAAVWTTLWIVSGALHALLLERGIRRHRPAGPLAIVRSLTFALPMIGLFVLPFWRLLPVPAGSVRGPRPLPEPLERWIGRFEGSAWSLGLSIAVTVPLGMLTARAVSLHGGPLLFWGTVAYLHLLTFAAAFVHVRRLAVGGATRRLVLALPLAFLLPAPLPLVAVGLLAAVRSPVERVTSRALDSWTGSRRGEARERRRHVDRPSRAESHGASWQRTKLLLFAGETLLIGRSLAPLLPPPADPTTLLVVGGGVGGGSFLLLGIRLAVGPPERRLRDTPRAVWQVGAVGTAGLAGLLTGLATGHRLPIQAGLVLLLVGLTGALAGAFVAILAPVTTGRDELPVRVVVLWSLLALVVLAAGCVLLIAGEAAEPALDGFALVGFFLLLAELPLAWRSAPWLVRPYRLTDLGDRRLPRRVRALLWLTVVASGTPLAAPLCPFRRIVRERLLLPWSRRWPPMSSEAAP